MMAGVQAAALLIAAKRADSVASEIALHTERNTEDLKNLVRENTELTELVKGNTDLLDEIHRDVTALANHLSVDATDEGRTSVGGGPMALPDGLGESQNEINGNDGSRRGSQ
jgi:hypothetical protein